MENRSVFQAPLAKPNYLIQLLETNSVSYGELIHQSPLKLSHIGKKKKKKEKGTELLMRVNVHDLCIISKIGGFSIV